MDRVLPPALREVLCIKLKLYEDGSVMLASTVGPDDTVVEWRSCETLRGPGALPSAASLAGDQCILWAGAGVLGMAAEADG